MPNLERINVDPSNPKYASVDGILFSKNLDQLIHYPRRITNSLYIIPRSVRYINPFCFHQQQYIETIVFHDQVLEFREGAFRLCKNIKSIMIPNKYALPKKLTNAFLDTNFSFPDNITFYFAIWQTCKFIHNKFDLHFIIPFITILLS